MVNRIVIICVTLTCGLVPVYDMLYCFFYFLNYDEVFTISTTQQYRTMIVTECSRKIWTSSNLMLLFISPAHVSTTDGNMGNMTQSGGNEM